MSQFRFVALLALVPLLTFAAVNNFTSISSDDLAHYLTFGLVFAALAILALLVLVREFGRRSSGTGRD